LLVVGAMLAQPAKRLVANSSLTSGHVYVFKSDGQIKQTLTSPTSNESSKVDDHFGISVSITDSGDSILVGAPCMHQNKTTSGVAFLFSPNGTLQHTMYNPNQSTSITPSEQLKQAIDFGGAVVIAPSGEYAAIGSAFDPAVNIVCLHSDCPGEQEPFQELERNSFSTTLSEAVYDERMCLVTIPTTEQLGGGASSKLRPPLAAFISIIVVSFLGMALHASRKRNQHRVNNSVYEAAISVHSNNLPEIL